MILQKKSTKASLLVMFVLMFSVIAAACGGTEIETVEVIKEVTKEVPVEVETVKEVTKEVVVEKEVLVEKETLNWVSINLVTLSPGSYLMIRHSIK